MSLLSESRVTVYFGDSPQYTAAHIRGLGCTYDRRRVWCTLTQQGSPAQTSHSRAAPATQMSWSRRMRTKTRGTHRSSGARSVCVPHKRWDGM